MADLTVALGGQVILSEFPELCGVEQEIVNRCKTHEIGSRFIEIMRNYEERVKEGKDEWLVMLGVCTHLGCVPLKDKGDYKGWFCPCHGSHYDGSGRVRKGPAPKNMEIPKFEFVDNNTIKIG